MCNSRLVSAKKNCSTTEAVSDPAGTGKKQTDQRMHTQTCILACLPQSHIPKVNGYGFLAGRHQYSSIAHTIHKLRLRLTCPVYLRFFNTNIHFLHKMWLRHVHANAICHSNLSEICHQRISSCGRYLLTLPRHFLGKTGLALEQRAFLLHTKKILKITAGKT